MTARRQTGGPLAFVRRLVEAVQHVRNGGHAGGGRAAGGPGGGGRWPQCSACFRRVPALCTDAEEGAEPCFFGVACGCCTGPHQAEKPQGDGKFQTSAQKAAE